MNSEKSGTMNQLRVKNYESKEHESPYSVLIY